MKGLSLNNDEGELSVLMNMSTPGEGELSVLMNTSTPGNLGHVTATTTSLQQQHVTLTVPIVENPILEGNTTEEFHHDGSLDAQVAAVCMTLLLILLLFSVLYSRMWKLREESVTEHGVVPAGDLFVAGPQVNLKQLIQTKLRHLRHIIIRKKRKHRNQTVLYHRLDEEGVDSDTEEEELFVSNHVT